MQQGNANVLGLAPSGGQAGARIKPVELGEPVESYSLRSPIPDRVESLVWRMLGDEREGAFALSSPPQSQEVIGLRAGIMLSSVRQLHTIGSLRAAEGEWTASRAMWIYHKLRLWEHDDTMTQKQQVFAIFQIGKTSFWMRVRAVDALEYVRPIPFDVITSCPHRTVWYALADRILSGGLWEITNPATGETEPVSDQQIIEWLTSDLGAHDLVAAISGNEPTMEQQVARFIGQATAMESLLNDRGIMLVQSNSVGLANVPGNGIIHGHDIITGESVHVVSSRHGAVHTYCPRCGSEIDPAELVIREEEDIEY